MIFKIVILFLIGMAVLAMFGKLRFSKLGKGKGKPKVDKVETAVKCPRCGAYKIGKVGCVCDAPPTDEG